ncbi:hypothetical protein N7468_010599 [Penicillium chermesinum]|uniref:T6SS Phospholipase effector Tle1-like catalytic domain-containing protein n=1 Tax=Penicillium chermesinum TaxID=63820 RepID=A0A9W9N7Y5_9EURO|nr:uncharacterized protein N7468_010599 [Penicillium chermesinum]KAJ5214920.1 hypothetical protein N7468_010599 [Penicillium chermesinum]
MGPKAYDNDCYELEPEDCVLRQRADAKSTPIKKRIIICCDGTWQSAVSGKKNVPSNVTRLCRALNSTGTDKKNEKWQQVVWYDSGVGTTALAIGDAIEGATGVGLEGNVIEAYNFCIYCFGFSRGAYTARTIAGLISDIGICHKRDLNKFADLWQVYKAFKKEAGTRFHRSEAWYEWMWGKLDEGQGVGSDPQRKLVWAQRPQGEWAQKGSREVELVGVYDTVGALGMPEVMGVQLPSYLVAKHHGDWHNFPDIKHAFQALALDESRRAFAPVLFYIPKEDASEAEVEVKKRAEKEAEDKYWDCLEFAEKTKARSDATDQEVNDAAKNANLAAKNWNAASRDRVKYQNRKERNSTLKQVWFPGYHINIGGGSSDTLNNEGDMEEMSTITFSWMLDQIKPHLSIDERFILDEYRKRQRRFVDLNDTYLKWKAFNDARKAETWADWAWRNASSTTTALIHPLTPSKEVIPEKPAYEGLREYGWGIGQMKDSYTKMYWANLHHYRTPGQYATTKEGKTVKSLGDTCEYIHPVVNYRVEQTKEIHKKNPKIPAYKPRGAFYNRRKVVDQKTGRRFFEYDICGCPRPIEEWRLGGLDSYERLAITGEEAYKYVQELDDDLHTGIVTRPRTVLPHEDAPVKRPKKKEHKTQFECELAPATILHKFGSSTTVTEIEEDLFESHTSLESHSTHSQVQYVR